MPDPEFQGGPTPAQYVGFDAYGNVSESATVAVDYPDASDIAGTDSQGEPVSVAPELREGIGPAAVVFVASDSNLVTELTVPGEGVWTVDPETGDITFTPEPGFEGNPTPVEYTGFDGDGDQARIRGNHAVGELHLQRLRGSVGVVVDDACHGGISGAPGW